MDLAGIAVTGLAVAAGGCIARSEYEKKHFVTESFTICSEKLQGEKNVVFLSDLHDNTFGRENERLLGSIAQIKPDFILIGGDMMVCRKEKLDLTVTVKLVTELVKSYPVFYANGNHEERMKRKRAEYGDSYDVFLKELEKAGVTYLSNQSVTVGEDLRITGYNVKTPYYHHRFTVPKMRKEEIEESVGKADGKRYQILLIHSPLFFDCCRSWGADLALCGHFHGGTIRLPFLGGVMTPQYQFFLPWCAGRFDREGKTMIVSRGLGTHSINIRLNNRPQLIHIRLKGK